VVARRRDDVRVSVLGFSGNLTRAWHAVHIALVPPVCPFRDFLSSVAYGTRIVRLHALRVSHPFALTILYVCHRPLRDEVHAEAGRRRPRGVARRPAVRASLASFVSASLASFGAHATRRGYCALIDAARRPAARRASLRCDASGDEVLQCPPVPLAEVQRQLLADHDRRRADLEARRRRCGAAAEHRVREQCRTDLAPRGDRRLGVLAQRRAWGCLSQRRCPRALSRRALSGLARSHALRVLSLLCSLRGLLLHRPSGTGSSCS
jgi:hypothetical protein